MTTLSRTTSAILLGTVVIAGSQKAPPVNLSAELRAHVQAEQCQIVSSLRGLPLGVRAGLQTLFGSQARR